MPKRASARSAEGFTESESIAAPTGLTVYAVTHQTVYLQWNMADGDVHVERSTDGETWTEVEGAITGSLDRNCAPDTNYQYRIFAAVGSERSVYSEVVEAHTAGAILASPE